MFSIHININMANDGRTRRPGFGERTFTQNPVVQEFVPSSGWTEDSDGHYLLVDLPDFKKEEVKLQVLTYSGRMIVSGERLSSDKKYIWRFHQTFTVPPNCDIDQITGKFDGEILYVTVPKRAVEEREPPKLDNPNIKGIAEEDQQETLHNGAHINGDSSIQGEDHGRLSENKGRGEKNSPIDKEMGKRRRHPTQFERAMKILQRNKGIIITAVLAFSMGVFVTHNSDLLDMKKLFNL